MSRDLIRVLQTQGQDGACPVCLQPLFVPAVRVVTDGSVAAATAQEILMSNIERTVIGHMQRHDKRELIDCIGRLMAVLVPQ